MLFSCKACVATMFDRDMVLRGGLGYNRRSDMQGLQRAKIRPDV
jgi:hypothetical protein